MALLLEKEPLWPHKLVDCPAGWLLSEETITRINKNAGNSGGGGGGAAAEDKKEEKKEESEEEEDEVRFYHYHTTIGVDERKCLLAACHKRSSEQDADHIMLLLQDMGFSLFD